MKPLSLNLRYEPSQSNEDIMCTLVMHTDNVYQAYEAQAAYTKLPIRLTLEQCASLAKGRFTLRQRIALRLYWLGGEPTLTVANLIVR